MTEFEPDWEKLHAIEMQANEFKIRMHPELLQASITELRRQEQAAGWVLVRREDVERLMRPSDYSRAAWEAAHSRVLTAILAATERGR